MRVRVRPDRQFLSFAGLIVTASLCHLHSEFLDAQEAQRHRQQELLEEDIWTSPSATKRQRWCQAPPQYHDPTVDQKLPFLTDVFAADEGKFVYFIGYKLGLCKGDWDGHQEFHSNSTHNYHFQCQFGGLSGSSSDTTVVSEPVASQFMEHPLWSDTHFTIRCPVPQIMQRDLSVPRPTTKWTVSLYSKDNPYSADPEALNASRAFQNLSLCNGEWPTEQATLMAKQHKKYKLSMTTKINSLTQVEPSHIVSWIEHHRLLGVEHFIIYDNQIDPQQHRPLSAVLATYIDQGLVTYIWYPIQDCTIDNTKKGKKVGERFKVSQITAANGVLRRYAQRTEYLIHADTDEFILLKNGNKGTSLIETLKKFPTADSFSIPTRIHEPCDMNAQKQNGAKYMVFEEAKCSRPDDLSPSNLILRPDRILSFFLHHPLLRTNGKLARDPVSLEKFMTLAHYEESQNANNDNPRQQKSRRDEHGMNDDWQSKLRNATQFYLAKN